MTPPHNICPVCMGYLLDYRPGWKKCHACGWCQDSHGENALTRGKTEEERKEIIATWSKDKK